METSKIVFITGITGNQGGAVAKHLLHNNYKVIGLTRDATSDAAKFWSNQGATIVEGNLNDPSSYQEVMNKSDAIFLVQAMQNKNSEIQQGKQFIDALKPGDTRHLIYASVLGADLKTGIPHFDSKNEIENHIKSTGINYTILRPASFYENYLVPQIAGSIKKGKFYSPLNKSCKQQMIGVDDIGQITSHVISRPEKYLGKTISIATDEYQISSLPDLFSEALGKPVKYKKLPLIVVRLAMGKDLYKMFKYMNKHNFTVIKNIHNVRKEFDIEGDYRNWVNQNFTHE